MQGSSIPQSRWRFKAMRAIHDHDLRGLEALLDSGLDPNYRDGNNKSAIEIAVDTMSAAAIGLLLERGARLESSEMPAKDFAAKACRTAVIRPLPTTIRCLVDLGYEPELRYAARHLDEKRDDAVYAALRPVMGQATALLDALRAQRAIVSTPQNGIAPLTP